MKKITAQLGMLALPLLLLSGCGGYATVKRDVDTRFEETGKKIEAKQAEVMKGKLESPFIRTANTVWLGSSSVPYERGSSLPPQFDEITLNFSGRHNIASVAEIIQRATGLRIIIHPDVQVSMSDLPRASGGSSTKNAEASVTRVATTSSSVGSTGTGAAGAAPLQLRMDANSPTPSRTSTSESGGTFVQRGKSAGDYFVDVPLTYRGSLSSLLDTVAARLGIDWEYRDGAIEIRRFITRTYNIVALPGRTTYNSSLGKSGGTSGSGGSFSSNMQVSSQSEIDYWVSLEGTLTSMLSNLGRLAVNQGTGTVTVTDVRDVIDRISRHIEEENRTMTRQIGFEVQLYSVRSDDGSEFGVDWKLVYEKLNEFQFKYNSPGTLVSDVVGDGSIKIIKSNNNFNGTEAFLKAAATGNKVSLVTSQRAVTLNRQAVPVAVTSQRSYISESKVTTTPGPPPVVERERTLSSVTTGFILNLMPSVTERNAMVLTVGLDLSELKELRSFGNIDVDGVQAPEVASTQFVQRVALRTGETLVLTGFEQVKSNSKERTLDNNVSPGLGGSFAGNTSKDSLVFLITPVMVEGL